MNISRRIVLFLAATYGITVISTARAVEVSTPSADPDNITENLKTRLKETINSVELSDSTSGNIGYVGKVKDIVKNTLVVEDKTGKKNIVVTDETTIVRAPGNTTIKLDSVRIGDAVIAIGKSIDNAETSGKRIIVSDTPFSPPEKVTGLAQITKIGSSSLELTPSDPASKLTLVISSKTLFKSPQGSLELTDLSIGDQVVYSALVDAKDPTKKTATVLMRIKPMTP